jgi:hypothetical protein
MHQYTNEDLGWLRLQDLQREAENRRLTTGGRPAAMLQAMRQLLAWSSRRRAAARKRAAGA